MCCCASGGGADALGGDVRAEHVVALSADEKETLRARRAAAAEARRSDFRQGGAGVDRSSKQ